MTTDQSNMVQEVKDPKLDPNITLPSEPTTKETKIQNPPTAMKGDVEGAFLHLKKIITFLESQDELNTDMIARAKKIRDHYTKSKTISEEQFKWIEAVVFPVEDEGGHGLPDEDAEEAMPPMSPEEAKKAVAEKEAKLKADLLAAAPPSPFESQVGPKPSADVAPSGEEAVDASEPEAEVVQEAPADPQPISEDAETPGELALPADGKQS